MNFWLMTCLSNTDVLLSKVIGRKDKVKQNVKNPQPALRLMVCVCRSNKAELFATISEKLRGLDIISPSRKPLRNVKFKKDFISKSVTPQ